MEAGVEEEEEENEDAGRRVVLRASSGMRAAAAAAGAAAARARAAAVAAGAAAAAGAGEQWAPTHAVGNLYRSGSDRVGPHSDRLTHIGPGPTIVGLSLGASRTFRVRRRWPAGPEDDVAVDIPLPHNSFCVMLPPCQVRPAIVRLCARSVPVHIHPATSMSPP